MYKNDERERAAAAFRNYARLGLPENTGAVAALCRIRGSCRDGSALDMLAVHDTLRLLRHSGGGDVVAAVHAVYFATSHRRIRSNEITMRVRRHAADCHCDERTIYRRLSEARLLWSRLRRGYGEDGADTTLGGRQELDALLGGTQNGKPPV